MHYYFTAVSLIAGICLGFGILYLFIGLRRKDNKPLNITFALFALCYATTLVNGIRWYSTNKITEYVAINRLDSIVVAGAFVALGGCCPLPLLCQALCSLSLRRQSLERFRA
jgi:cytochrome c oxidase assembly factor CtaG